jgi:acyl carrier protein
VARVIDYGPGGPVLVLVKPNVFCSGPELRDISAASLGDSGSRVTVVLSPDLSILDETYPDPATILAQASYAYSYEPPATRTEAHLITMWNEVLGRSRTGALDDFLDLGGDSVSAVRLINRISKELGVELDFAEFFDSLTVRAVAGLIDAAQ